MKIKKAFISIFMIVEVVLCGFINPIQAYSYNNVYSYTNNNININNINEIKGICGTKAACEVNLDKCYVDVNTSENPYDVIYDYGEEYQAYIDLCDWSLVFDVDYYKKTFPMLATLYNDDELLLLKHFQTVGIHEGRQGSESFNVGAYANNCPAYVKDAFADNYEGYYIYYILNYDKQNEIDTLSAPDVDLKTQYKVINTAMQNLELRRVNDYREAVGVDDVTMISEANALANYRAYINSFYYIRGHEWAKNNTDEIWKYVKYVTGSQYGCYGENNVHTYYVKGSSNCRKNFARLYYNSPEHRDAMLSEKYNLIGVSNSYIENNKGEQFDVFF